MNDEVDEVVRAWQRERSDMALEPMHVWSRIDRLSGILDVHRKAAFSQHEIESWEFDVLAALRRAGEPVTSGTMTNRIDRLATRGAVTREPDPNDGRGVLVSLTRQGLMLVDAALESLLNLEATLLRGWEPEDRTKMAAYLRRLLLDAS